MLSSIFAQLPYRNTPIETAPALQEWANHLASGQFDWCTFLESIFMLLFLHCLFVLDFLFIYYLFIYLFYLNTSRKLWIGAFLQNAL